jgi:hypothetical protein
VTTLEKKLAALVTIMLLVGFFGGYALNYVIFQPQIQGLQNSLDELNETVNDYNATIEDLRSDISSLNATIKELDGTASGSEDNQTEVPVFYESLQFQNLTAVKENSNFELNFTLKNTGNATAALEALFLNSTMHAAVDELSSFAINGTDLPTTDLFEPLILLPGDTASGVLTLAESGTYTSGTVVVLSFRTISLKIYSEGVSLP